MQISIAHQGTERDITQNNSKSVWSKAYICSICEELEEVKIKFIHLNAWQRFNVVMSQMFLRELVEWRNGAFV